MSTTSNNNSMKPILKQTGNNISKSTPFFVTRGDDDLNNNILNTNTNSITNTNTNNSNISANDFRKKLELERIALLKSLGSSTIKNNNHEKLAKMQYVYNFYIFINLLVFI